MLFIVKVYAAAPTLCLAQHLFVDLPFFQLVDPIPQQWAFVCHSSERSEGEVQKKKKIFTRSAHKQSWRSDGASKVCGPGRPLVEHKRHYVMRLQAWHRPPLTSSCHWRNWACQPEQLRHQTGPSSPFPQCSSSLGPWGRQEIQDIASSVTSSSSSRGHSALGNTDASTTPTVT